MTLNKRDICELQVIGKDGQLGQELLQKTAYAGITTCGVDRMEVDITSVEAINCQLHHISG